MIGEWLKGGLAYFFLYFSFFFLFLRGLGVKLQGRNALKLLLKDMLILPLLAIGYYRRGRERNGPGEGEWKTLDKKINTINGEG